MDINGQIDAIVNSAHADPFSVLGAHPITHEGKKAIIIRAFIPAAKELYILRQDGTKKIYKATKIRQEGVFECIAEKTEAIFPYKLKVVYNDNNACEIVDSYCFLPVLSDFDLHLISEGTHYKKYEKLGAHVMKIGDVEGVFFAVWAPNALRVSVIGDFNSWDGRTHPMRLRGHFGVWELFIPGLKAGDIYKYEIKGRYKGFIGQKVDPYAFYCEARPKTACIIHDINTYKWNDDTWVKEREKTNWLESPMSIYEVHLGSWQRVPEEGNRFLTYRELAERLIPHVQNIGFTHIELMPINEHPLDASWGYQPVGYFAPTSRFGNPDDFMYFIDKCHQAGLGVIIDWVPAHFPRDSHGLAYFDGTCLYEHADPRRGEHKDWGTLIFNYGRNEVINFLICSALFWIDKYHIDGLRVDAVASMLYLDYSKKHGEWLPNQYGGKENLEAVAFLKKFNEVVHGFHPGVVTIAEESTSWPMVSRPTYIGGLGFSMKWNMGWMHDILHYFQKEPVHRKYHHNNLTFALLYAFTENFINVFSHDEVVYLKRSMLDKMPGDIWQKFANLRALYAYMYAQPGKQLMFMGGEFGQWREWNFDGSLDWHLLDDENSYHQKLVKYLKDLNILYKSSPSLYEIDFSYEGFEWVDFGDYENSVVSFLRKAKNPEDFIVCVFNLTPVPRKNYRVGVPKEGFYKEVLNSDADMYGGGNLGNWGGFYADNVWWQGRPFSLSLQLPPLSAVFMKPWSKEQEEALKAQAETKVETKAEEIIITVEPQKSVVVQENKFEVMPVEVTAAVVVEKTVIKDEPKNNNKNKE